MHVVSARRFRREFATLRSALRDFPPDESPGNSGDIAIAAHGGAGTLLLSHLRGDVIGRQHDQPRYNGGNYFAFDATTRRLHRGWHAIDA